MSVDNGLKSVIPVLGVSLACVVHVSSVLAFDSIADRPAPPRMITPEITAAQRDARRAWWVHDRFGMFIHFGLYSMLARHEWVQSLECIPPEKYSNYAKRFNPDLFDARSWAKSAKTAGMRYMVLTTKHHDGFCLWDTKTTDFCAMNTPIGRDLVREFVDACRAEGLKIGFYFSIKDWHHKDYLIDKTHPCRPGAKRGWAGMEDASVWSDAVYENINAGKNWGNYQAMMFEQVKELLGGRYGKIDIIWFDYTVIDKYGKNWTFWKSDELVRLTRKLQPGILIDSRLDLMDTVDGWDFVTPEQCRVSQWPKWEGHEVPWETCQTFSGSWGYNRDESSWKTAHQLVELLINSVAFGGNLILNVGPTGRGEFDCRAKDRLHAIGDWMRLNSRSIYGCTRAPVEFKCPVDSILTYNAESRRLYIHLVNYPMGALPIDFGDRIEYAQFLHDASEIDIRKGAEIVHAQGGDLGAKDELVLPMQKPSVEIPVVECFLK